MNLPEIEKILDTLINKVKGKETGAKPPEEDEAFESESNDSMAHQRLSKKQLAEEFSEGKIGKSSFASFIIIGLKEMCGRL